MEQLLSQILPSLIEVGSTIIYLFIFVIVLEGLVYLVFGKVFRSKHTITAMLIAPAAVGLLILVVYPLLWELNLSLTNMSLRRFGDKAQYLWVACAAAEAPAEGSPLVNCLLKNYVDVFRLPVLKQVQFFPVFLRTVLWTFSNVAPML